MFSFKIFSQSSKDIACLFLLILRNMFFSLYNVFRLFKGNSYKPLSRFFEFLLYISYLTGDNCFIRLGGLPFSPWAMYPYLKDWYLPLVDILRMSWMLAAFWLLSVYRTRWQGLPDGWSHNLKFYLRCMLCFLLVLILVKITTLLQ